MDHDFYILSVRSSPYMTVKETGKAYGRSTAAIYQDLKEIGSCDRYNKAWTTLNDEGDWLINTLVYEDFLHYRTQLKDKNMARRLPPYSAEEVRRQRGEYKQAVYFQNEEEQPKELGKIKELYEAPKGVFAS